MFLLESLLVLAYALLLAGFGFCLGWWKSVGDLICLDIASRSYGPHIRGGIPLAIALRATS